MKDYVGEIKSFISDLYPKSNRKQDYSEEYLDYFLDVFSYYRDKHSLRDSLDLAYEDTTNIICEDYRNSKLVLTFS